MLLQEYNFIFDPHYSFLRISQRKLRRKLSWLAKFFLAVLAVWGIILLIFFLLIGNGSLRLFYLSVLTDMFLFYLWQKQKEDRPKIQLPQKNEKIEIYNFLDEQVKISFEDAWLLALRNNRQLIQPIHLFISFLKTKDFFKILKRLDCQSYQVRQKAANVLALADFPKQQTDSSSQISPDLEKVFFDAYLLCLKQNSQQISSLDLLWAMAQSKNSVRIIFDEFGISLEEIEQAALWAKLEKQIIKWEKIFSWRRLLKPKGQINRAMTAAATPLLNQVSQDYTQSARQGQFEIIINWEKELDQIFSLWASSQSGVVLVGDSGVGKTTIIQKLAQMMVEETVPKFLQDKRLVKLDVSNLMGLSDAREKGEEYFKKIIFEIRRAGNVVLFIENIENIVGLKAQAQGLDFSEIVSSALAGRGFYLISTTSLDGFAAKIEKGVLGRDLAPIKIKLPEKNILLQILTAKIYTLEKQLEILYSVDALNMAIDLADRYLYGQALTAKAIDLLEEAGSIVRGKKGKNGLVAGDDITALVAQKTDVPLTQVQAVEKGKLLNLEEMIHQTMINQEKAVIEVSDALRRGRAQIKESKRPIANFLFVGPTGVGKTELAKTLARVYFGSEKKMIRIDMSEYQEKRDIRRLIGCRTDTETSKGFLTEAVKRMPHSIILLDELEKTHPDILNLFLQLMDDGRLTDAFGETINFTNVILIATTNAGTKIIQDEFSKGNSWQVINNHLRDKILIGFFSPEFLNRFDSIILFKPLSIENMTAITGIFIKEIQQGFSDKGIEFETEPEAIKELAMAGYDPMYGARPLRRVIQEKVDDALARLILEDKISRRDKVILKKGEQFEIVKAPKI